MKQKSWLLFITLVIQVSSKENTKKTTLLDQPLVRVKPCKGNENIDIIYDRTSSAGHQNEYNVFIFQKLFPYSTVTMTFDLAATVTLADPSMARITTSEYVLKIHVFAATEHLNFVVKGPQTGTIPYVTSLLINDIQYCGNPQLGILDKYISPTESSSQTNLNVAEDDCGRRKIVHTELITKGLDTKPGDFPWHVAVYRIEHATVKYICGGTLVSKTMVLTAAHCATIRGVTVVPDIFRVVLGKYNLIGGDEGSQEREVYQVIVHENYNHTSLDNDIAFLKLKSEAVFSDFVQPACFWHAKDYEKLNRSQVLGTVVGWGLDQSNTLSNQLRQAIMPKVSEKTCIKSNPGFYVSLLNDNKFCAGYRNGTSACNGDSSGGFVVFVPDVYGDKSPNALGSWHVRGIVSVSIAQRGTGLCDPNEFVIFTDLARYNSWMRKHITNKI